MLYWWSSQLGGRKKHASKQAKLEQLTAFANSIPRPGLAWCVWVLAKSTLENYLGKLQKIKLIVEDFLMNLEKWWMIALKMTWAPPNFLGLKSNLSWMLQIYPKFDFDTSICSFKQIDVDTKEGIFESAVAFSGLLDGGGEAARPSSMVLRITSGRRATIHVWEK